MGKKSVWIVNHPDFDPLQPEQFSHWNGFHPHRVGKIARRISEAARQAADKSQPHLVGLRTALIIIAAQVKVKSP